jgi:hypothetical protein
MTRAKRTYNLPDHTVQLVRELSVEYGLADTQDGVVELAVDELARHVRDAEEAEAWAAAAVDPEFQEENRQTDREFAVADRETWPAE